MELLEDKDYFIIRNGEHSLWCSRSDGSLSARRASDLHGTGRTCLGVVDGVIGKLKISQDSDWKLLLVKQSAAVGTLPRGLQVFKIIKVLVLTLGPCSVKDIDIKPCPDHHPSKLNQSVTGSNGAPQKPLQRTWNQFKQAAENIKPKKFFESFGLETSLGFKIPPLSDLVITSGQLQKETKGKEKFEKKVLEELVKMFNDSESFYFCPDGDITNCIQRQQSLDPATPFWQRTDDRFFWNKYMLQDLINSKSELCRPWLIPIIQGYVQIEVCHISFDDDLDTTAAAHENSQSDSDDLKFKLCLVSRRSRHRAGTRYKRRGVDDEGNTANYVETEQILEFRNHIVSFVQVRGSVPLYWEQTGIKYKPPPKILRGEEQNHKAFVRHFEDQLQLYKLVTAISLVDQLGKEKVISDTFLRHVITYNNPLLTYVTFDFHEYCRGMRFENIGILTENITDIMHHMGYCWVDKNGTICEQRGVFRVNCIDCLDRTNIVQSALARIVLEIQCRKLGLLSPERPLAPAYRTVYQQMWANNGDIISCQYAGTAALKGDYTRTGERRLAGMMKDGMNSANRYYINRVKDVYRQATVDLMLGNPIAEEFVLLSTNRLEATEEQEVLVEKEENLKTLIDECKKMLITEPDECLGGWGLINCDQPAEDIDPAQQDMDIILLLSQKAYYVAHYDDDCDRVTSYQKIELDDLERIEIGELSLGSKHHPICLRIFYRCQSDVGYFHTFCATSTRLFNNIVVGIHNQEEARESLRAVGETFVAAKKLLSQELVITGKKFDKQKTSKPHVGVIDIASEAQVQVESSVRPKTNVSRDSTSENLIVSPNTHETTVAKLIHLTENPSSKLTNIGRAMAGMIPPMKKMNTLRPKVFKMLPTVLYHKENIPRQSDEAFVANGKDITDSQQINLPCDRTDLMLFEPTDAANTQKENSTNEDDRERFRFYSELLSSSDSELSESEINLAAIKAHNSHIFLRSAGLLMISKQHIVIVHRKQQASARKSETNRDGRVEIGDGNIDEKNWEGLLERKKALLLAQVKSKSLDVDENLKLNKESDSEAEANQDIIRKKKSSTENLDARRMGMIEHKIVKGVAVGGAAITSVSKSENSENSFQAGNIDNAVEFPLIVIDDQDSSSRPPPLLRRQSLLKISYSEGSLSNSLNASQENVMIDLDELDLFDSQGPSGSALNKLRVKVANLALPVMAMPENRQRQLKDQAKNNRLRSQLRFKELKTRIILL